MFSLLETIVGFAVIMLMLSLLVKCLTSVLKNHIDYYTKNLYREVQNFVSGTLEELEKKLSANEINVLKNMNWKRLGEEYLTKDNMIWLMKKMDIDESKLDLESLKARLDVHKANIRFMFEKNNKNIALVIGLALCMFMNINAFSIWERLYNDQQLRTKFSSDEYVNSILNELEKEPEEAKKSGQNGGDEEKEALELQRRQFKEKFYNIQGEINFGIGRIYSGKVDGTVLLYEFFGSLLTGILISIGAPYWHDILRTFSAIRKQRAA